MIANTTPEYTIAYVDYYVEANTNYTFYKHARLQYDYLQDSKGDCTDKAKLKCAVLNKNGVSCRLVHGYAYNIHKKQFRHDFYQYKINGSWFSSEPNISTQIKGVW